MRRLLRLLVPLVVALCPALATTRALADPPVMVAPKLEKPVEAAYPDAAQTEKLSGEVLLSLDIDATGAVTDANVLEPAGHGFDEAAVAACKQFVFAPATRDGQPIPSRIKYRYAFTWKDKTPPPPIATTTAVAAQTGELVGTIKVMGPDIPLVGAQVDVTNATGASVGSFTTIADGGFDVRELPAGTYRVVISANGFASVTVEETVYAGKRTQATYRLAPPAAEGEILVVGDRPPREVTVRTLEQREMSRIPGTNGDALKSLQSLPGVGRSPGFGAALIVRGAAPQDTQVFVEGVAIPIVYHFGGLSSVIPTEMLDRLDFRPGNFGVEYGRVMGGIVDVRTMSAPTDGKFHGLAQADFIDARFVAKGPIPFLKNWAFVVGGRRSYVDLWLKPLLASRGAGFTAAPIYYDWQAFAETHPTTKSRLRFGFYGSDDNLAIFRDTVNTRDPAESGDLGIHTGFGRFQGSYESQLSKTVHFRQVLAYGWDVVSFTNGSRAVEVVSHPFTDRSELSVTLGKGYVLHLGADVLYTTTRYDLTQPRQRLPGEPANGTTQVLLTEQAAPT
ncbi:MAG: TonB family protein, partial [Polyangiales bacterium]